jgi:dihydrolipoamide dehydrogenase
MTFDLAIIGGGPGGYTAALKAAKLGLKVVCIEKRPTLGGTCLNVGCIPSKALLQTTALYAFMKNQGPALGMDTQSLQLHFDVMMQRKDAVVKGLTTGIPAMFKALGVEWVKGSARFTSPTTLSVEGERSMTIDAKQILIATGSEPISLPFLPFDEKKVLSSTGALSLPSIPKTLIVVGAGVIGVEIASVYNRLGTKVTLVEMLDHICGNIDSTIHQQYLSILTKQGLDFHLSTKVKGAEIGKNKIALAIEERGNTATCEADAVLVSIGRRPYTEGLELEKIGVQKNEKGFIQVNDQFQTAVSSIYAIGDAIDGPMLAHRAFQEGTAVAEHLAGASFAIDYMTIPNIIYTHPELASVGMTESEAKQLGLSLMTGISYMKANARARCAADTEGLVKVIGDKASGKLLGLHILAALSSEMIAEGVVAIRNRMTVRELANTCHGHPTYSEAIQEACLAALSESPLG